MLVWIFEDNLMWSARLAKSVQALGHEAVVLSAVPAEGAGDVAILNLGSGRLPGAELAPLLKARGVFTIAHAGHKEKALLEVGRVAGCDRIATNSELTFKLEGLLAEAGKARD